MKELVYILHLIVSEFKVDQVMQGCILRILNTGFNLA